MARYNKDGKDPLVGCEKCSDLLRSRNQVVLGYGDKDAQILFVGLAPGRNGADVTGVPFTKDPSGVLFQEAMISAGFSNEMNPKAKSPHLNNVYVTNLVKCNPKDENGRNRLPSKNEIENCIEYLYSEIAEVNPDIIVPFGKLATEWLLKQKIGRFGDFHNKLISSNNQFYIPFYHPSYVIRGAYPREKYLHEIRSIINVMEQLSIPLPQSE